MSEPKINIVIVTWNALDYTKFTIKSLLEYTKIPFCLTIVDNNSNRDTIEYLDTLQPQGSLKKLKIIKNKVNLGFGGAIDLGYNAFDTPYVCIANNDIVFSKDWLFKLLSYLVQDQNIGIIRTLRPATFVKYPWSNLSTKKIVDSTDPDFTIPEELAHYCQNNDYDYTVNKIIECNNSGLKYFTNLPFHIVTCCAVVNKNIVNKAGGIADLQFQIYGAEDTDLSWRIIKSGFKLAIATDVYIHHFRHKSINDNKLNRIHYIKHNNNLFYKKWKDEIKKFLEKESAKGVNINECMTKEEYEDYWFLRRLNDTVKFWSNEKLIDID